MRRFLVLALVATALIAIPAVRAAAKDEKVDVCHVNGQGEMHAISVSVKALPAHLAHGDASPDEGGLDADCAPVDWAAGDVELLASSGASGRLLTFDTQAGTIRWSRSAGGPTFDAEVTAFVINGNHAKVWGTVTASTFTTIDPGFTFYFEVWDGTPDTAAWQWLTGLGASQTYVVTDGDLVVFDSP